MDLIVENLAVARGGLTVLEGISFTLEPGQALVLRGANGIGKTTLLRTLAGLQPAAAGSISFDPESLTYAAHADGLKAVLTVEENLTFWAEVYGKVKGREGVLRAMERMNLTALAKRPAANLSAGQKRRLGLARLLLTGRPVWVLDEPTVSLDVDSVVLFAAVVREHLAQGGMAIIATHIDLGLEARVLQMEPFRAKSPLSGSGAGFDEAFL